MQCNSTTWTLVLLVLNFDHFACCFSKFKMIVKNWQLVDVCRCCSMKLVYCSLGPLVNKVKDVQVETIVDTLCSNMLSEKEQLRDISSIGKLTS